MMTLSEAMILQNHADITNLNSILSKDSVVICYDIALTTSWFSFQTMPGGTLAVASLSQGSRLKLPG